MGGDILTCTRAEIMMEKPGIRQDFTVHGLSIPILDQHQSGVKGAQ